jgi:hypothetical protein
MTYTADNMPAELRARLAEYQVLATYHYTRRGRYGDMANGRRSRELNRLGDALIDGGAPLSIDGAFPTSTGAEIVAAWNRVARPRIARVRREAYRHGTPHTQATMLAWIDTARKLGINDNATTKES